MKRVTQIVILLIILGIFGYMYYEHSIQLKDTNSQNSNVAQEVNDKIRVLREKKKALQDELEQAKQDLVVPNMGTTILLISDTNEECLTDIVSKLDKYNYAGVIAIDNNYSPIDNIDGYLNVDDINGLVDKGYEVVIKVNGNDDVAKLYELYSEYFDIVGFYYPGASITRAQVDYYKQIGINNIIIYNGQLDDNSIFSITGIGSYDVNARQYFDEGNTKSLTMAFSVGYTLESDKYTESNFDAMLEKMDIAKQDGKTDIGNITFASNRYEQYQNYLDSDEYKTKLAKVDEIQSQINDINNQLNAK